MATKEMQAKLNGMLKKGIADVKALGIDLYDIVSDVRITKNSRRIGSAQDLNRAFAKYPGSHDTYVIAGRQPLFRISISEKECGNDYDIMNVLYHEILHCAPNCQNHQKTWKSHAARVNSAYGSNVTTTKAADAEPADARPSDVRQYVGKCFKNGGKTYKFTGFNGRPKNNCDIVDIKTGRMYVCPSAFIAKKMKTGQTMFGASVTEKKPEKPGIDATEALKLVGRKVKNGPRGRKVFTVVSVDVHGGPNAIELVDENGSAYAGPLGCVRKLIVVG